MIKKTSNKTSGITMADLLAKASQKPHSFKKGDKVEGKVLEITSKALILDIGGKSEGIVAEKAFLEARNFIRQLKVGDKVAGEVIVSETPEGYTVISLRNSAKDFIWSKLEEALKSDEEISVEVKGANQSGVIVDTFGLSGFVPKTHLGKALSKNPNSLIGKRIKVKIVAIDKEGGRLVLSEKAVSEKEKIEAEKEALKALKVGEIYEGEVTTVTDFGVFVRITPNTKSKKEKVSLEGLVHISELSWDKVGKPSDLFREGDKIKVKVLEVYGGKLSLSVKQAQEDPWQNVSKKYQKEERVKGKVVMVSDFGVFVALEPGVEGLIHITKIPPATNLRSGDEVSCVIEEVNPEEKRISLGLVLTSKPLGYK